MATTSYAFTDPRAQTIWAPDVFEYALQNKRLTPLMGMGKDSIIHVNKKLTQEAGGTIVFKLRDPLSGAGKGDDGDMTNSEEQMTTGNMSVEVHTRMNAVLSAGMQSEQLTDIRKVDGFRRDAKERLGTWIGEAIENDAITTLAGLYNENSSSSDIETVNESYPSGTARIYYGGQSVDSSPALDNSGVSHANDAALTVETAADNYFGTLLLDHIRGKALVATPRFTPGVFRQPSASSENDIRFDVSRIAGRYLVVLAHPGQVQTMRSEVGTNGWANMTALCRAQGDNHPIFMGGNVMWNGMIVVEYDRIPTRLGAGGTTLAEGFALNAGRTATTDACANGRTVARALLLGAQAMCMGWAAMPGWFEDYVDANKLKVKTEMIYGFKKTQFNAHGGSSAGNEHAVWAMDTAIA